MMTPMKRLRRTSPGVLLLVLAACAAQMPEPEPRFSYRREGAAIYSNAVLDPARLAGDWRQVAAFAADKSGCTPGKVRFGRISAGQLSLSADLCLSGAREVFQGQAAMPAAGRIIPQGAGGLIGVPWWILWADSDMRTLVIGTPKGETGFILERSDTLPADRLKAARDVLDWNGYELDLLQVF